ncbi:geranylgeranyl pyrophosphate synthase [Paraliobacillus quinghaiensis]|uniref:Geranylgeranyl pyrophosphate synthase n=1 Tax=Paraliobacillus quinghaiensis TaxID=470815 RepID=A0A917TTG7_9BACI|nr:polyprenyl synthetase family protein [Paraliobacillus quinghaiensis]GGM36549.1 geranylgeranyl pyrophosphate synthase [Paraliobacillus quinghaiensis]
MRVHPMWNSFPALQADLANVLELIDTHIRVRDKTIEKTIKDLVHSGGKLLRPAYSLLCAEIGPEYDKEKATAVAAALETLHMATLVHDDVIDGATTRHGIPTIHTTHGNQIAIYSGDYLFSVTFTLLSRHATSLAHLEFNSRSMEKILSGELDQLHSRFKPPESVKNYLSRISGKTAQLFAVSCYSGAIESNASRRNTMNAWNMGHYIGMAFQIMDDILDYKGNEKTVGKPVMADVQQGIYTLPLIYAMQSNRKTLKPILEKQEALTDQDMQIILRTIEEEKGLEKAQQLAERYTKKALKELNKLPNGTYKDTLYQITTSLLNRNL